MSLKRLVIICTLPSFLAACSEFYGSQPPAPLYGNQPKNHAKAPKKLKPPKAQAKEIVKTQPLKGFSDTKPEPLLPLGAPSTGLQPLEPMPLEQTPLEPLTLEQTPKGAAAPSETMEPLLPSPPPSPSEPPEPAEPAIPPFEPIEPTVQLSPAVNALVMAANQNSKAGDLDSAAASLERAIRIEPRNATLHYKLALLSLKQSKTRLAEELAKKSALLASTDNTLKKHCWLLIAHAREIEQDLAGAKEAREKADSF